jgi:hypothetical protein
MAMAWLLGLKWSVIAPVVLTTGAADCLHHQYRVEGSRSAESAAAGITLPASAEPDSFRPSAQPSQSAHEFGHTIQFIGLSGLGGVLNPWTSYLALGAPGTVWHTNLTALKRPAVSVGWLLLLGTTCGKLATFVHAFALRRCPEQAFDMPERMLDGAYSLVRTDEGRDVYDPGSELYTLHHDDQVVTDFRVRLVRDETCRVEVRHTFMLGDSALNSRRRKEGAEGAGIVARLLFQGTSSTPIFPAQWIEHRETGLPPDSLWNR